MESGRERGGEERDGWREDDGNREGGGREEERREKREGHCITGTAAALLTSNQAGCPVVHEGTASRDPHQGGQDAVGYLIGIQRLTAAPHLRERAMPAAHSCTLPDTHTYAPPTL